MQTERFTLPSSDGLTPLNCCLWTPEPGIKVKALIQFCHGMCEHIGRYAVFAEYLTEYGFAVIGHDHLGHGYSLRDESRRCYFAEEHGDEKLILDMHLLTAEAKKRFPGVPDFILGHSMGSFLVRRYLTEYSGDVRGAVIMGTGFHPLPAADAGILLALCIRLFKGEFHRSRLLSDLILGSYNRKFSDSFRGHDWLSKEKEVIAAYEADPMCGVPFTAGAWLDFFRVIRQVALSENVRRIRKDLPVLIISGADDAVGGAAACPKVKKQLLKAGLSDVTLSLYEGDRHEILREADGENALREIREWMEAVLWKEQTKA